jgi:hypothetical protein
MQRKIIMKSNRERKMNRILIILLLITLVACSPAAATPQYAPSPTQPAVSNDIPTDSPEAIYTSAAATINAQLTEAAPTIDPNLSQIPTSTSYPTQNPACIVKDGSWSAMTNGNTISIIFTVTECKISAVFFQGTINGQWLIFSNSEATEPVNGSQFDFLHSFTDQDRYRLSGTFTSPITASIQMVIFKGFRLSADQPSPFIDDMIINGIANP